MEIPTIGSKQIETSQEQVQKTTKTTSSSPQGVASATDQLESAVKTGNQFAEVLRQGEGIGQYQLVPEQPVDVNIDLLDQDGSGASGKKENANLTSLVAGGSETIQGGAQKQMVLDSLTQMFPTGSSAEEVLQKIDHLVQGDFSKLSFEGQRAKLLEGLGLSDPGSRLPSGNVIDSAASATDPTPTPYGKGLFAYDSGEYRTKGGTARDKVDTNAKTGTTTFTHEEKTASMFGIGTDITYFEHTSTKVTEYKTDNTKTETTTTNDTRHSPDGSTSSVTTTNTTTTNSDGSVDETTSTTETNRDGKTTTTTTTTHTPPPKTKDPGGYEDYDGGIPEALKLQLANQDAQLRALKPQTGSGDVDPNEQADSQGTPVKDAQVHLFELGKLGLLGNPDTTREVGGVTPGSPSIGNVDGNIDPDDDST